MTGLIYKDFMLMRKQITYIAFLLVLYTVLSAAGVFNAFILPAIVVVLSMIYPMNAFAYDDLARWDKFAVATPAGRRGMVAARYLFVLLLLLLGSAVVLVLILMLRLFHLAEEPLFEQLLPIPACAVVGLLMNAILLPLLYKFGAEKARILSVIVFAIIFGGCAGAGFLISRGGFPELSDQDFLRAAVVVAVIAVVAFIASYFLSQRIYARKEL